MRFKRPCKDCGEMYLPTSRSQDFCLKCYHARHDYYTYHGPKKYFRIKMKNGNKKQRRQRKQKKN